VRLACGRGKNNRHKSAVRVSGATRKLGKSPKEGAFMMITGTRYIRIPNQGGEVSKEVIGAKGHLGSIRGGLKDFKEGGQEGREKES